MRKLWISAGLAVAVLVTVVAVATAGRGDGQELRAHLSGYQEVPAVSTAAEGRFTADIDGNQIHFTLRYSGIEGGSVSAAHIHFAQEDVNGGVAAFLCGGAKPACPQSGEVRGTITADDVVGPAGQGIEPREIDELIRAMRHELTYVNVHSPQFPNGEIRGQIGGEDEDHGKEDDSGRHDDDDDRSNGRDDDDDRGNGGGRGRDHDED